MARTPFKVLVFSYERVLLVQFNFHSVLFNIRGFNFLETLSSNPECPRALVLSSKMAPKNGQWIHGMGEF